MAAPRAPLPSAPRMSAEQRRYQLAQVAARRFHRLGYHRVSLGDVAAEAGVTGPAVYRHFRNKEALLAAAIASGLDLVEDAVSQDAAASLDGMVTAVAEVGIHRPDLWVLLQRESRLLGPELRAPIQEQFGRVVDRLSRQLRRERPGLTHEGARLLVTAATAVLSLPSTTRTRLAHTEHLRELSSCALAVLRADLDAGHAMRADPPQGPPAEAGSPLPRREQVVDTAVELFLRRGYSGVSLDDIGAAVGIAGPSILHHFPTKSDILVTAFDRASDSLSTAQGHRRAVGRAAGLDDLVTGYVTFALQNRTLLGVYVSEAMFLPADALERTTATILIELRDWSRALLADSLDLDEQVARLRVHAALAAVHDLVRLGHFAERPRIAAEIVAIAIAVLRG